MARKLYVGNLPYDTAEQDLQSLFAAAGTVDSVNVMRDMATGRARGFAFVEMGSDEEAQAAIAALSEMGDASVAPALVRITQNPNADHAMRLQAVGTLVGLGLVNLPLAVPVLCTIAYNRHRRDWAGWLIVAVAAVACVGLLVGGLIFMASGQTFEEFSR